MSSPATSKTAPPKESKKPIIMVSSTVYGVEDLSEQIFAILNGADVTVWMSYKGTVPTDSTKSNFENCLAAVDACDLFLGILTTSYGSGVDKGADQLSITHQEISRALQLEKPRWFIAHRELVFARSLVRDFGYRVPQDVPQLNAIMAERHQQGRTPMIRDYRVLEIYDEVIQAKTALADRRGNWAQPFSTNQDANIFVVAQFLRYAEAIQFVKDQPLAALAARDPRKGPTQ
jgi:hypothetical protein